MTKCATPKVMISYMVPIAGLNMARLQSLTICMACLQGIRAEGASHHVEHAGVTAEVGALSYLLSERTSNPQDLVHLILGLLMGRIAACQRNGLVLDCDLSMQLVYHQSCRGSSGRQASQWSCSMICAAYLGCATSGCASMFQYVTGMV